MRVGCRGRERKSNHLGAAEMRAVHKGLDDEGADNDY